ncbi:ARF-like 2-binding protein, putative [Trypanosoma equiperdum]|uniref:ARF-like 2-binding protein n=3 Tax=Trypanozoon TaxID=39700 RepID=D0A014_TRYB9|nr:hypothetical protein, unlikely [Trypanosoma brucei gambiense DAL972]RHW69108.1 ARF-like 2-binding protein [Trypanosoma brucei equiperdum]CBH16572.1 hypothetical protein, unlikely [Trypanosoma brucei gambiense DAL972]SCU69290.1 ARF-like 2-binding protein, putative [Trypanosoma equiperdum]|eukprot:XP_011778836.1 hypothetical protein, unlikely [Trypanosoma brucei gambiense DAL972]
MDSEEGEFVVYGDCGSAEDAQFDQLVGAIEDFMVNLDQDAMLAKLPPFFSVSDEHERHKIHRELLKRVDADLDEHVLKNCQSIGSMENAVRILESRKEEISEDVLDFVSDGFLDYNIFVEAWEKRDQ